MNLAYREGYYAEKQFSRFNSVDKERQLEDALMLEDPITELSIAMEIDYFQLNRAEYFVPIVVKIPGRELALAKRGGAEHTLIDFVGEIKDLVGGTTVTNLRDNANIKLTDATAAELAHRPIEYDAGFTLLPGRYSIKFLARDDETGRIGTYQTIFTIPNLNKEDKRIPISSVVLSSQRVDQKDALFDAAKSKDRAKESAVNPLVEDGKKLIPSVTRVFSTTHEMYVFLQAYKPPTPGSGTQPSTAPSNTAPKPSLTSPTGTGSATPPGSSPLFAYVSLYRADRRIFESAPLAIAPSSASRLGTMPLSFNLGLTGIAPGEYDCQVTVLDPSTLKTSFWRAPIRVIP